MISQVRPAGLDDWFRQVAADAGVAAPAPLVLDVREPAEWQAASLMENEFAVLKISMREVPRRLAELDPTQPIACLCHHGARSQQVAAFLLNQGFEHVANIVGGIDAWALERDGNVPRY